MIAFRAVFDRGARIDGYEVWGRIGGGGMSDVWLAKHEVLAVPVVIKTLREEVVATAGTMGANRMFDEARLMARVTSPRVVRAVDAGTYQRTPYLVQEYVDGIDMAELDRGRRKALGVGLPLWVVSHVMAEACQALHAAHQAGVFHRDVKPSNLFAAPEAGIRLGDFGIAVARAEGPPQEVCGTIKFMAPEQLQGAAVDRATDVYGAGATAFDLRYGHAPFGELAQILDPDLSPPFPPPRNPAEAYFQHLLATMLAKDRADRFVDAAEPGTHFAKLSDALRPGATLDALHCLGSHRFRFGECEIELKIGDLSEEQADGIVSSANYEMKMRSGAGDSLRRRGGDEIEEEAMREGERALGVCVVTGPGRLRAKKVLHAVSAWNEASCVGRALIRALLLADELGLRTLAVPALGTGAARVSMETCANAMMTALRWHIAFGGTRLQKVTVVLWDEAKLRAFREVAEEALRGQNAGSRLVDLGLPVEGGRVTEEGATVLDTSTAVNR